MGHDQELFLIEVNLVGGILQINGQIAFVRLQRQIMDGFVFLLLPYFVLFLLRGQRKTGTYLDDIAALYFLLLYGGRQVKA